MHRRPTKPHLSGEMPTHLDPDLLNHGGCSTFPGAPEKTATPEGGVREVSTLQDYCTRCRKSADDGLPADGDFPVHGSRNRVVRMY